MIDKIYKNLSYELGIELSADQITKFEEYYKILIEWNSVMNLTGITDHEEVITKLFFDSLTCLKAGIDFKGAKVIDIGTGAGFPGMPIKILIDQVEMNLLDSLNKRINFLKEVCSKLDISDVNFFHGRAEDYGQNSKHREKYDIVISRAVADLGILSEYAIPFLKIGGCFIAEKSSNSTEEIEKSKEAIRILGGEVEDVVEIKVPGIERINFIVVIRKLKKTPIKYPRKAGTPTKNPL